MAYLTLCVVENKNMSIIAEQECTNNGERVGFLLH
jgi:hypothetical protein